MHSAGIPGLSICLFLLYCADGPIYAPKKGEPYLRLTRVQTPNPTTVRLFFSEPVAVLNNQTNYYRVTNASTGERLTLASANVSGQSINLGLQAPTMAKPYTLIAGHVFDVRYNVKARDNEAQAAGTERFLADFWPPDMAAPEVWQDSVSHLLVLCKPNLRVGNTGTRIWRKTVSDRQEDMEPVVTLGPLGSAYWAGMAPSGEVAFAVQGINDYGEGKMSSWTAAVDAGEAAFELAGACLRDSIWDNASADSGYYRVEAVATCERVEFRNDSLNSVLIYEISGPGLKLTKIDSTGKGESKIIE